MSASLILWALFSGAQTASAADVTATYCFTYEVDFDDAAQGDYFVASTIKSRGAKVNFVSMSQPSENHFLAWNGPTPGCADITLDDAGMYTVSLLSESEVNGNTVEVTDEATGQIYLSPVAIFHNPVQGATYNFSVGPGDGWNALAIAGWGLTLHPGGFQGSGEHWEFIIRDTIAGSMTGLAGRVRIGTAHTKSKFVIGHEFGHSLTLRVTGAGFNTRDDAALDGCSPNYSVAGHRMNSKEFASLAAVEGIANFYSAAIQNNSAQYDCDFQSPNLEDWDRDGTADQDIYSCEDGVPSASVDSLDYLGDYCVATGIEQNRATEYDYLRHFWDFHTNYNASVTDIFDIWFEANADTWNRDGNGADPNNPAERLSGAAFTVGGSTMQSQYDFSALINGADQ